MIKTLSIIILASFVLQACENPLLAEIEILRTRASSPELALTLADESSLTQDDTLDYGMVSVGGSGDITITVRNNGNSSLSIGVDSILLTMGGTTEEDTFTLVSSPAAEIPEGETSPFTLRFSPVSGGAKSATLSIPSNDYNNPVFTLSLTGAGWVVALTTAEVTNVEMTTATGGGNITDDGGIPITERGICWGETINPTVDGSHIKDSGEGTGSYSALMTGLSAGTFYYVRAYATNGAVTVYGPQVSFTTKPSVPSISSTAAVPYEDGSGKMSVSWTSANGPSTYYDVYYSTTDTPPGSPNGPTDLTAASCTLTGLTDYTTYYVWVRAKNSSGASALSSSGTAMVGIKVGSITLDKTPEAFLTGTTETITATVDPVTATNPIVNWTSSNSAYATVADGVITPGSTAGNVTITASAADGFGTPAAFTAYNHANGTIGTSLSPGPAGGTVFYDKGSYSDGWRYLEVDTPLRGYG
ncbi:MAG: fibronectin type III domain-containing protein, partial [Spirochaetales bacterium]|nr:fibronectin type III domain-containing protein [Spirochaetales bacterium]